MMAEKRLLSSLCCDVAFIYLFLYMDMQQLMRRCAPLRHIDRPNLAGKKEERRQEDNLLSAKVILIMQTGHPYSSGIYEVLRMVRKLTKSKS